MPNQVIPINELHTVGIIKDTPAVSLPPNAFTDARNVRFRDGAVIKMEGEHQVPFGNIPGLVYCIWWPNPNRAAAMSGYYIVIRTDPNDDTREIVEMYEPTDGTYTARAVGPTNGFTAGGQWQHTFFQGGFAIVINNGVDVPHYILDTDGNTDINMVPVFAQLPGWESYTTNEEVLEDTFMDGTHQPVFDLGQLVDFTVNEIAITLGEFATTTVTANGAANVAYDAMAPASMTDITVATDADSNTTTVTFGTPANINTLVVHIAIRSQNPVEVRAGVVRSFGDVLVAGNLIETDEMTGATVRNLAGVVRVSDVAIPGAIPNNWNPFAAGVSTADEFTLSNTGTIQDMAELQGNLFIYNTGGISQLRRTGNAQVPWSQDTVSDSWGCQTTNGVLEFDGKHMVVGSHDIYLFGGHPGSIQSVADGRVREFFFNTLSQRFAENMFLLRYQRKDEIWVCYPDSSSVDGTCTTALIWNYRLNNWTQRDLNDVHSGVIAPVPGLGIPRVEILTAGTTSDDDGLPFQEFYVDLLGPLPETGEVLEVGTSGVDAVLLYDPRVTIDAEGTAAVDYLNESDFIPLEMEVTTATANVNTAWGFDLENSGATTYRTFESVTVTDGIHTVIRPEVIDAMGNINQEEHFAFFAINNEATALRVGEDSLDHIYFEGIARGGRDMFIGFIECDADGNVAAGARQFLVDVRNEGNPKLRGDWQ